MWLCVCPWDLRVSPHPPPWCSKGPVDDLRDVSEDWAHKDPWWLWVSMVTVSLTDVQSVSYWWLSFGVLFYFYFPSTCPTLCLSFPQYSLPALNVNLLKSQCVFLGNERTWTYIFNADWWQFLIDGDFATVCDLLCQVVTQWNSQWERREHCYWVILITLDLAVWFDSNQMNRWSVWLNWRFT